MGAGLPWTQEENEIIIDLIKNKKVYSSAAIQRELASHGFQRSIDSIGVRRGKLGLTSRPKIVQPPSASRPIEDLIEDLEKAFQRKKAHHQLKKKIKVKMEGDGPYAIAFFGDPHVGDPGSNFKQIMEDIAIIKDVPRCFAVNMGDLVNNWIGSLARIGRTEPITDDEEILLMDYLLTKVEWLWVVLGNHDKWTKVAELKCKEHGIPYVSHGGTFEISCGASVCRIDSRHTHRGHSMYNGSHAQVKQNFRGSNCDIIIAAHTHISAQTVIRNGISEQLSHCVRVGSYKQFDEYADMNNFEADDIGPVWMAVINPEKHGERGFVTGFWDLEDGVSYLNSLTLRVAS